MLTIGVLGPLDVSIGGRPVALTAPRLRTLLAVLTSYVDRAVSADHLAAAVWDDDPPDNPRRAMQLYVTRLRGALGAATIRTTPAGYQLQIDPDRVDSIRMIRLLDAAAAVARPGAGRALLDSAPPAARPAVERAFLDSAAAVARPAVERALLAEALALWRGTPFEGLRSAWLDGVAQMLTERFLGGLERRVGLDLADPVRLGEVVAELSELTMRHPLRERFWGQLMVALSQSGRRGEALECYGRLRRLLAEELGVEPGPELRDLHRQVLSGKPSAALLPAAVPGGDLRGAGAFISRGGARRSRQRSPRRATRHRKRATPR